MARAAISTPRAGVEGGVGASLALFAAEAAGRALPGWDTAEAAAAAVTGLLVAVALSWLRSRGFVSGLPGSRAILGAER